MTTILIIVLLILLLGGGGGYYGHRRYGGRGLGGILGLILIIALLPLSMTMALIWKTKEVILASVFDARR